VRIKIFTEIFEIEAISTNYFRFISNRMAQFSMITKFSSSHQLEGELGISRGARRPSLSPWSSAASCSSMMALIAAAGSTRVGPGQSIGRDDTMRLYGSSPWGAQRQPQMVDDLVIQELGEKATG
jgi:hypothetical protein